MCINHKSELYEFGAGFVKSNLTGKYFVMIIRTFTYHHKKPYQLVTVRLYTLQSREVSLEHLLIIIRSPTSCLQHNNFDLQHFVLSLENLLIVAGKRTEHPLEHH